MGKVEPEERMDFAVINKIKQAGLFPPQKGEESKGTLKFTS